MSEHRNIKLCIITGLFFFLYGQKGISQKILSDFRGKPAPYSDTLLEKTKHNILYEFRFVKDPDDKENTGSALTLLQIGSDYAKFLDYYVLKDDSLHQRSSKLKYIGREEMNQYLAVNQKIGFSKRIIRDLRNQTNLVREFINGGGHYEYQTAAPEMDWELLDGHKRLLGHPVQKAKTHYKGRDWVAWFAKDIPIHLGPYTFGGLPGLILELKDTPGNFHFRATGIDNKKQAIYKRNETDRYISVSKKELFKKAKLYHERPDLFSKLGDALKGHKIPYNPIEIIEQ